MLGVIGGTGLSQIKGFEPAGHNHVATPFCETKIEVELLQHRGCKIAFLRRHGSKHTIPPHKVNYQANIWALHKLGVDKIVETHFGTQKDILAHVVKAEKLSPQKMAVFLVEGLP